jgi:hypothetical protein
MSSEMSIVAGVMPQPTFALPVSIGDFYCLLDALIGDLAMNSKIFVKDGSSATPGLSPNDVAFYCFVALAVHIKRVGTLTGTDVGLLPNTMSQLIIPNVIAKFLEGLGTFSSQGVLMKSTMAWPANCVPLTSQYGSAGSIVGFTRDTTLPKVTYDVLTVDSSYGDLVLQTGTYPVTTLPGWLSTYMDWVSEGLSQCGLRTVPYAKIPSVAPNADAYSIAWDEVSQDTGVPADQFGNVSLQWLNLSDAFNPEASLLWGSCRREDPEMLPCSAHKVPIPQMNRSQENVSGAFVSFFTACYSAHYCAEYLQSRCNYRPGALMNVTTYCDKHVTTLNPLYRVYNLAQFNEVIYGGYEQLIANMNNPAANSDNSAALIVYWLICQSVFMAKYNRSIPFHVIGAFDPVEGDVHPQTFLSVAEWLSFSLPVPIAKFVDSVGPSIRNGRMEYPYVRTPPPSAYFAPPAIEVPITYMAGLFMESSASRTAASNWAPAWPGFHGLTPSTNPTVPMLGIGTVTYNVAWRTASFAPAVFASKVYYPNCHIQWFLLRFRQIHALYLEGSSYGSSLVHLHDDPCGSVVSNYAIVGCRPEPQTFSFPTVNRNWSTVTYNYNYSRSPSHVCSDVNLTKEFLAEAVVIAPSLQSLAQTVGRYVITIPTALGRNPALGQLYDMTYTPESQFSKAISAKLTDFDPTFKTIGGVRVTRSDLDSQCFVSGILATIFSTIYAGLEVAAPIAGAALAGAGIQTAKTALKSYEGILSSDVKMDPNASAALTIGKAIGKAAVKAQVKAKGPDKPKKEIKTSPVLPTPTGKAKK